MKSKHTHFIYWAQNRFMAIDNDRCLTPQAISHDPNVPKEHAQRVKQWEDLVFQICDFPAHFLAMTAQYRAQTTSLGAALQNPKCTRPGRFGGRTNFNPARKPLWKSTNDSNA